MQRTFTLQYTTHVEHMRTFHGSLGKFKSDQKMYYVVFSVKYTKSRCPISLVSGYIACSCFIVSLASGGQISTKHLKTSIRPFFATCRLPQNPEFSEFWRCYRPRHTFLGPHWKRSLKSLDTLLTVTTPNTQLLPRGRKMLLSS